MKPHSLQKKIVAYMLLFSCVNLFVGCNRFYRPVEVNSPNLESKNLSLRQLTGEGRYFILRKGKESYSLSDIVYSQPAMTLTASVHQVRSNHNLYTQAQKKTRRIYVKSKQQDAVLEEVHLFIPNTLKINTTGRYVLDLSDIQKIEVIEFDKGKTTSSYVLGTIGFVVGAVLIAAIISAATYEEPEPTSSCPYISTYDGEKYVLQGEIYGGAIFPQLQRDDYLPLKTQSINQIYSLKISNELQEIQHTDFADLLVVEHNSAHKIMIGPDGQLHTILNPQAPLKALLNNQMDVSTSLLTKDNKSCLFNGTSSPNNSEELNLTFKNDLKNTSAKLVLNLKSSSWFDNLYSEFTKGLGSYYPTWIKKQSKEPSANLEKWMDEQHIPLTISVNTPQGWKIVKKLKTIGPLLNRELIIPLSVPADEQTEIKLSCGYLFWEVDYASIDFSDDEPFTTTRLKPFEAINELNVDVLPEILQPDRKFLNQPNSGDATILKYKVKKTPDGKTQTFFLHSSGYYEHVRNYKGTPKTAFLKSFKKPGAFPAFSKRRFSETWKTLASAQQ